MQTSLQRLGFKSLQDRICLQNSLGGEQTILSHPSIYPQYSGVLETCLALRYWFFEVLGSESVNSLFVIAAIACGCFIIGPCFVMQY